MGHHTASQFKELVIYGGGEDRRVLELLPLLLLQELHLCTGSPLASDKRRVGVLMMSQAQLSYSCVTC